MNVTAIQDSAKIQELANIKDVPIYTKASDNPVFVYTCTLITQALKNDKLRISLNYMGESCVFDTGVGIPDSLSRKSVIEQHINFDSDNIGITLSADVGEKILIKVITYEALHFSYDDCLRTIAKWIKAQITSEVEIQKIKANRLKSKLVEYFGAGGYEDYFFNIPSNQELLHIYKSGSQYPVEFKVLESNIGFTLVHIATDVEFSINYFELLNCQEDIVSTFCANVANLIDDVVNYEHNGYSIIGFFKANLDWYMSLKFDNEAGEYIHIIECKRKQSDLLTNLMSMFKHYSDIAEADIAVDDDGNHMLTIHQLLNLKTSTTEPYKLSFDYTATNPLFDTDVVNRVILEYTKPITDLVIKHI
jgi:hypothetical protein